MPTGIGRPAPKPERELLKSTEELEARFGKDHPVAKDTRKFLTGSMDRSFDRRHDLNIIEKSEAGTESIMRGLDVLQGKKKGSVDVRGGQKGLKWFNEKD
jgi:hypothetical protein